MQHGSGTTLSSFTYLDRGYTSHEHLTVGLVHMNGRLYDSALHRFLMPDNFVQDGYNTQSFNRYAYVLNNPLGYTDPTGELTQAQWDQALDMISNILNDPGGGGGYIGGDMATWAPFSQAQGFGYGVGYMNTFNAWGGGPGWASSPQEALNRYNGGNITPGMVEGYYTQQWAGMGRENISASYSVKGGFNVSYNFDPGVGNGTGIGGLNIPYNVMAQFMGMGNDNTDGNWLKALNSYLTPFGYATAGIEYQLGKALSKYNRLDQIKPYNEAWMLKNNPYLQTRTVNVEIPGVARHIEVPRNVVKGIGTGLKVFGAATAAVSAWNDINRYQSGEISGAHLTVNLIMNGVGFLGPIGTGVSILYGVTEEWWW